MLLGRERECGTFDRLLEAARAGESRALMLRAASVETLTFIKKPAGSQQNNLL